MKDKRTRKSRGVAFVQFLKQEDAKSSALAINGHEVGLNVDTRKTLGVNRVDERAM